MYIFSFAGDPVIGGVGGTEGGEEGNKDREPG